MYLNKRKKDPPRSDLRSRLEEYSSLKEKTWWWGEEEDTGPHTFFDYFPLSILKDMHSFVLFKITAGLLTILLVTLLTLIKLPLAAFCLEKIQYVTTWQMDFAALGREAAPVIKKLWAGDLEADLEKVVLAPGGSFPYGEAEQLLVPLEGELIKTFGFQYNPYLQKEEMFYGLVFAVPEGARVRAAASGRVKEMKIHPDYGLFLLLEHAGGLATVYGYLQHTAVGEGDVVKQGQEIAQAGQEPLLSREWMARDDLVLPPAGREPPGGRPALYFEVREDGEPVDPLPLLVKP